MREGLRESQRRRSEQARPGSRSANLDQAASGGDGRVELAKVLFGELFPSEEPGHRS